MTDDDLKIFKSLSITQDGCKLQIRGVFSDEFQDWLTYWMSDEIMEKLKEFKEVDII